MRSYQVLPTVGDAVYRSYPVLHGEAPGLTLERWEHFCFGTDPARHSFTVVSAMDDAGYARGVAAFATISHVEFGATLYVPIFATASMIDAEGVTEAMLAGLTQRAHRSGTRTMLVSLAALDEPAKRVVLHHGRALKMAFCQIGVSH